MRRFLLVSAFFAGVLLLLSAPQVRADGSGSDTFTFSEQLSPSQTVSVVWQLPASPDPGDAYVDGVGFALFNVCTSTYLNGTFTGSSQDSLLFLASAAGGGFLDGFNFGLGGVNQVYTGAESNPTFVAGTYSGFDSINLDANGNPIAASLTISTPEPSSLLLLLCGFLAVLGTLALKKVQA
jgi:hypothetical protein